MESAHHGQQMSNKFQPDDRIKLTVSCEEGDGSTLGPCSTSSAYAVNIVLRVIRIVIIEHMSDVADIFILRVSRNSSASVAHFIWLAIVCRHIRCS